MIVRQVIRKIIRAIKRDWGNEVQPQTFAQKMQAQMIQDEIAKSIKANKTFQNFKTDNVGNKKILICRPEIKAYSFHGEVERSTRKDRRLSELDIMETSLDIEHVWKLLRLISNLNDSQKCEEIWGCKDVVGIINKLSPYKLIEKLELYRSSIKRGCVVQHELDEVCGTVLSREGRMRCLQKMVI